MILFSTVNKEVLLYVYSSTLVKTTTKHKEVLVDNIPVATISLTRYKTDMSSIYSLTFSNVTIAIPDNYWFVMSGVIKELFDIDLYPCHLLPPYLDDDIYFTEIKDITIPDDIEWHYSHDNHVKSLHLKKNARDYKSTPIVFNSKIPIGNH